MKRIRRRVSLDLCPSPLPRQHSSVPRETLSACDFPKRESESMWVSLPSCVDAAKEARFFPTPSGILRWSASCRAERGWEHSRQELDHTKRTASLLNCFTDPTRKLLGTPGVYISQLGHGHPHCSLCSPPHPAPAPFSGSAFTDG